ncbi:short-subunit dehydrogenase [Aliiruegeria haliotis]|uniref:Short-subunit dehydrogenase n=1 Tax=Aliiruegeria haliotis TaxID=1280846 RepID=A0A2T0RGE3_9RHOB|nr:SDR family NAD(P)-dependent oxidoreductase [Aliiruegeria haliotis]PRY20276.1 short-subunit dehydrogenase [Aliiruegeria haliotis]
MAQKSILITGCSSGIGYAVAHGLKDAGWRVFATCRNPDDVERLTGEGLESFCLDLTDTGSITAAVAETITRTGGTLDALYSNAAIALPGAVEDLPTDGMRAVFETNLFGLHELTRQVIPVMRAQGHGRIVQCSSVLGLVPMKWRGSYVASKYALEGLTDVLRLEMADTPIKVILVEPGPVTSRLRINSIPHFERWIDWKASPRAAQYERSLLDRLYTDTGPDRFEVPPEAVTEKILAALASENPAPRYFVTKPTYIMNVLRRILTTRALDRVIQKG